MFITFGFSKSIIKLANNFGNVMKSLLLKGTECTVYYKGNIILSSAYFYNFI